ncbi:hypothetical protein V6N12_010287 [Hibiscus sabdariffa]|uniref:Secreted protein n=1 Tax=Hibiscus sabdariffa TaxID=183260 RepID=A0ABR2A4M7_9ROSI
MGGLAKRCFLSFFFSSRVKGNGSGFADTAHSKHFLSFSLPLVSLAGNTVGVKMERERVALGVIGLLFIPPILPSFT